jgi:hypothetical protein
MNGTATNGIVARQTSSGSSTTAVTQSDHIGTRISRDDSQLPFPSDNDDSDETADINDADNRAELTLQPGTGYQIGAPKDVKVDPE